MTVCAMVGLATGLDLGGAVYRHAGGDGAWIDHVAVVTGWACGFAGLYLAARYPRGASIGVITIREFVRNGVPKEGP